MLIASVVELGLQVVVLSGIVWVVTGTLQPRLFDCRRRDDYALRRTDGDVYQLHLGCRTDRQRPATDSAVYGDGTASRRRAKRDAGTLRYPL